MVRAQALPLYHAAEFKIYQAPAGYVLLLFSTYFTTILYTSLKGSKCGVSLSWTTYHQLLTLMLSPTRIQLKWRSRTTTKSRKYLTASHTTRSATNYHLAYLNFSPTIHLTVLVTEHKLPYTFYSTAGAV